MFKLFDGLLRPKEKTTTVKLAPLFYKKWRCPKSSYIWAKYCDHTGRLTTDCLGITHS